MPSEKFTPTKATALTIAVLQQLAKTTPSDRLKAIARCSGLLKLLLSAKKD